jgi:hypothetical protein
MRRIMLTNERALTNNCGHHRTRGMWLSELSGRIRISLHPNSDLIIQRALQSIFTGRL